MGPSNFIHTSSNSTVSLPLAPEEAERRSAEKMTFNTEQSDVVLADTSALLHSQFRLMMTHLLPTLQTQNKKLSVTASSIKELKKNADNPEKPAAVRQRALEALHQLVKWEKAGLIEVIGSRNDRVFADPQLIHQIVLLRHRVDAILVITNDYKLSDDLLAQQVPDSGTIRTVQINRYGYFSNIPTPSRRVVRAKPFVPSRPQTASVWASL